MDELIRAPRQQHQPQLRRLRLGQSGEWIRYLLGACAGVGTIAWRHGDPTHPLRGILRPMGTNVSLSVKMAGMVGFPVNFLTHCVCNKKFRNTSLRDAVVLHIEVRRSMNPVATLIVAATQGGSNEKVVNKLHVHQE